MMIHLLSNISISVFLFSLNLVHFYNMNINNLISHLLITSFHLLQFSIHNDYILAVLISCCNCCSQRVTGHNFFFYFILPKKVKVHLSTHNAFLLSTSRFYSVNFIRIYFCNLITWHFCVGGWILALQYLFIHNNLITFLEFFIFDSNSNAFICFDWI